MNREKPYANKYLHLKDQEKHNQRLLNRLVNLKFSNISSIRLPSSDHKPHHYHQKADILKAVNSSDLKHHRLRNLLHKQRIEQDNKSLYSRLTHQKSTISTKHLAQQRLKQLEYLKRIRKFPYQRSSLATQPSRSPSQNGQGSLSFTHSHSQPKARLLHFIDQESKGKEHLIVLFSKVVQVGKSWFTVKFIRFKSHYQIQLVSYPQQRIQHSLVLPQIVGTALLSQTDYDYLLICKNCIKLTSQFICLTFELAQDRKKHFYRFEKKVLPLSSTETDHKIKSQGQYQIEQRQSRKTVFAIQNQKIEEEQRNYLDSKYKHQMQGPQRVSRVEESEESSSFQFNRLNTFDSLNIKLSNRDQYLK